MPIITGAQVGNYLGITDSDDEFSLDAAASAACAEVQDYCGEEFDQTATGSETVRTFRPTSPGACWVNSFWDLTNLVVKTDDSDDGTFGTTWTRNTDFILEPLNGRRSGQAWPYNRIISTNNRWFPSTSRNRAVVQVTAAWGWNGYPSPVVQAATIWASRLYRRANSPEGVLGGFADYGPVRVTNQMDPDVVAALSPYRRAEGFGLG